MHVYITYIHTYIICIVEYIILLYMLQDLFWHICIYIEYVSVCFVFLSGVKIPSYRCCLPSVDRFTRTEMTTEMWSSAIGLGSGDRGYSKKVT